MIITLPNKALKYLDSKIIQVEIDENLLNKKIDIRALQKAKGLLRKYNIDGLEYQKTIRKEWDRNIEIR